MMYINDKEHLKDRIVFYLKRRDGGSIDAISEMFDECVYAIMDYLDTHQGICQDKIDAIVFDYLELSPNFTNMILDYIGL